MSGLSLSLKTCSPPDPRIYTLIGNIPDSCSLYTSNWLSVGSYSDITSLELISRGSGSVYSYTPGLVEGAGFVIVIDSRREKMLRLSRQISIWGQFPPKTGFAPSLIALTTVSQVKLSAGKTLLFPGWLTRRVLVLVSKNCLTLSPLARPLAHSSSHPVTREPL